MSEKLTESIQELTADEAAELEGLESLGARMTRAQAMRLRFLRRRRSMTMLGFDWPLWDSAQIATANTTELTLFQEPKGQSSKTLRDTNMAAAGFITTGDYYDIHAIGMTVEDAAATAIPAAELREILYTGVLELYIADRLTFQSLLIDLPFGGGPVALNAGGGAAVGMDMAANGIQSQQNQHNLRKKIRIPRNVHFLVKLLWPTAPTPTTAIDAIVRFQGILWRRRT